MIAVTGATGQLGRLTVLALLEQGVPAKDLVAIVRTPSKAARICSTIRSIADMMFSRLRIELQCSVGSLSSASTFAFITSRSSTVA